MNSGTNSRRKDPNSASRPAPPTRGPSYLPKAVGHAALRTYGRRTPNHRGKLRLLRATWRALTPPPHRRTATLRRAPITVDCDLTQYIQWNLYFRGEYEPGECALWMRLAKHARIVVDAGANIGLYSLLAAHANPNAIVHAFEPTPRLWNELVANSKANNLDNIVPHQLALSSAPKTMFLHDVSSAGNDNEGINYVTTQPGELSLAVTATSMDDFCSQHAIKEVDIWKLDVEGSEYDALCGAYELLSQQRVGCVLLELTSQQARRAGASTSAIRSLLVDHGYSLFRFSGKRLLPLTTPTPADAQNVLAASPRWLSELTENDRHSTAPASRMGGWTGDSSRHAPNQSPRAAGSHRPTGAPRTLHD